MTKRYDFKAVLPGRFRKAERKRGEYVKFSDHESEMKKQRDEFLGTLKFLRKWLISSDVVSMVDREIKRLESHPAKVGEKGGERG